MIEYKLSLDECETMSEMPPIIAFVSFSLFKGRFPPISLSDDVHACLLVVLEPLQVRVKNEDFFIMIQHFHYFVSYRFKSSAKPRSA